MAAVTMPFVMGMRVDRMRELIDLHEHPDYSDYDMLTIIGDIIRGCQQNMRDMQAVAKAFKDNSLDHDLCQRLRILMSASLLKIRNNDARGLDWCIREMKKEIGYNPTPFINIRRPKAV